MSFKYEIGDEFTDHWDGFRKIAERKVSTDGEKYYWIEDETGRPTTYLEYLVDGWAKIEPYFEVGDWWRDRSGNRYEVTHVDEELTAVWVIAIFENGQIARDTFNGRGMWDARKDLVIQNRKV